MNFETELAVCAEMTEEKLSELLKYDKDLPEDRLREAMAYSCLGGGKRLRAFLCLEFCALCGEKKEKALEYASALEMIHAFSLIHDDLPAMDDDCMRRGKPSCHIAFGEATAILAGDALLSDAFAVASASPLCTGEMNASAVRVLAEKAGSAGMTGGQQLDMELENKRAGYDDILRLIDKKTGALLSCACMLGCISAGADREKTYSAEKFGLLCGRAFQIKDDLLDLTADSSGLGKTAGKDEKSGKSTLASLLGYKKAEELAFSFAADAEKALCAFPDGDAKEILAEFCGYMTTRKK